MNIFLLNLLPKICAMQHIDAHVRKMIIEYAQLLCTAHRVLDGEEYFDKTKNGRKIRRHRLDDRQLNDKLYKSTHVNHPCAVWVRESVMNYAWLYELFVCLCDEYVYRFGKIHLTDTKLRKCLVTPPRKIPHKYFTKFPLAMPDDYKRNNCTIAYKIFYIKDKQTNKSGKAMNIWTKRDTPSWMIKYLK